jgi:hypothetical protein
MLEAKAGGKLNVTIGEKLMAQTIFGVSRL